LVKDVEDHCQAYDQIGRRIARGVGDARFFCTDQS